MEFQVQQSVDDTSNFKEYQQLIISITLIIGAALALKVMLAIMDALNDIPVLAPTFKLIGFSYSIWFISRYLLKSLNRQKLIEEIQALLNKQVRGGTTTITEHRSNQQERDSIQVVEGQNQQLFKPGEIVPESGRYEVLNSDRNSEGREVTSTKGEHFPPTPESGMYYKLVDPTKHKNKQVLNQQENNITTISENERLYKPGEIVPESGQYELINSDGSSQGREVTSTKGEHFPPTPEPGMHYKLVDPTQHKKT